MSIHKYIFIIEDGELEIYKNGKLETYDGEEKYTIRDEYKRFWTRWKRNSGYIENEDKVNFMYISKDLDDITKFRDSLQNEDIKEIEDNEDFFEFNDIKKVLNEKDFKKILFDVNESYLVVIEKLNRKYKVIKSNNYKDIEKFYLISDNLKKDIFKISSKDVGIDKNGDRNKLNPLADYFLNKRKRS